MARQRKRGGSDDGGGERWLATYGDAITLLMAFFVMLYAMSSVDVVKFKAFVKGLEGPFQNKSAELGLLDAGPGIVGDMGGQPTVNSGVGVKPEIRVAANISPQRPDVTPLEPQQAKEAAQGAIDDQLARVKADVEAKLVAAGLQTEIVDFVRNERGLVISIAADNVLFDSGSAHVAGTGQEIIAAVADALKQAPNDVLVEGHTDNVPLRRATYTNWNLSTDRAVAVLSRLIEVHQFPPQRIAAVGYGEYRPRAPNDTPEHRALNRRVDILVIALATDVAQ